jgi:hypothetical protein
MTAISTDREVRTSAPGAYGTDDVVTKGSAGSAAHEVTPAVDRLAAGMLAGVLAGAAMYAVLAGTAVALGRSVLYPAYAVEAMMTGRRVLPDHPVPTLDGRHPADLLLGPAMFLLPAVAVAVLLTWWTGRAPRGRGASGHVPRPLSPLAVLPVALALTAVLFVLLVLLLGFHESRPAVQRLSSGYGVRQLGVWAWLVAHAVYVAVLSLVLRPANGAVARARRHRRHPAVRMRGESVAS